MSQLPTTSIIHKCDNPRRIVFATHHYQPDPAPDHECLPIIGFPVKFSKEEHEGKREECAGDHIIMFGYDLFRPRKTGFTLCLN